MDSNILKNNELTNINDIKNNQNYLFKINDKATTIRFLVYAFLTISLILWLFLLIILIGYFKGFLFLSTYESILNNTLIALGLNFIYYIWNTFGLIVSVIEMFVSHSILSAIGLAIFSFTFLFLIVSLVLNLIIIVKTYLFSLSFENTFWAIFALVLVGLFINLICVAACFVCLNKIKHLFNNYLDK